MTILAISQDDVADSRRFAERAGLDLPLLADPGGAVSRAYVGIDGADVTIPGVVVIRQGGTIAYRQIATGKDDRLTAAQLVAVIDRELGTGANAAGVDEDFGVLHRWQLRLALGGGLAEAYNGEDTALARRGAAHGSFGARYPIGRYLLVGAELGATQRNADGLVLVTGRIPLLHDTGAFEVSAIGGVRALSAQGIDDGPLVGGRVGAWLAWTPTWGFTLDLSYERTANTTGAMATAGLAWLFER